MWSCTRAWIAEVSTNLTVDVELVGPLVSRAVCAWMASQQLHEPLQGAQSRVHLQVL